ncbi:MAG TPA: cation:proton antiporter, partial [Candidatus Aminicenantes bacterium]|nr:cation:proton antiporter [Candidatus Aminicenantes bacterium]
EIWSLAEIGVVMLLFTVGLEFSPETIRRIGRIFFVGGGVQVCLTIVIVTAGLLIMGRPFAESLLFGLLLTHTSTTVLLKVATDRGEVNTPPVQTALGISLFQDIGFVPMAALVPVLARAGSASLYRVGGRLALSLLILGAVFFLVRAIIAEVLFRIVGTRLRELFLLMSLFICLGMSLLSSALGLSLALGAFLAGILIAGSPYSHQVVSDILPFKDVFSSLLFVSIGMLLNVYDAWAARGVILFLIPVAVLLKLVSGFAAAKTLKLAPRTSFLTALGLVPLGEFSFALAGIARTAGLLAEAPFQAFMATSVLTILITPLLLAQGDRWADSLGRRLKWRETGPAEEAKAKTPEGHVIIAGFGLNGRNLAKVLREAGIPYVVLELNPETVRSSRRDGEPVIFGDVSSRTVLREAGIGKAKVMVVAISDPKATRRAVRAARDLSEGIYIIARVRFAVDVDGVAGLGADEVIPEEFETSIEIFARVLDRYHVPRNLIDAQVQIVRGECYGMLRGTGGAIRPVAARISDLLTAGTAETYFVGTGAWPAGRTLGELDLRGRTGATVVAVVRNEESFASPGAGFELREQDTLVLVANHRDMDRAFRFLETGRADGGGG